MKMSCCVLVAVTLAAVAGRAQAQNNWVTANGGDARRSCFVDVTGPAAATVLWQGVRPTAFTRPFLVVDDRVYICWINPANIAQTRVVALDRRTGAEAWAVEVPNPQGYQYTYSRPAAYVNGRLIVTRADGYTKPASYYALDPANGSIVWTSDITVMEAQFQSPTISPDGDLIAQARPAVRHDARPQWLGVCDNQRPRSPVRVRLGAGPAVGRGDSAIFLAARARAGG